MRWVSGATIFHRILANKLRRNYFLELHYRQGLSEGAYNRADKSRFPPMYLFGQLVRAIKSALHTRFVAGRDHSLRLEMNVVYFVGYILGWIIK